MIEVANYVRLLYNHLYKVSSNKPNKEGLLMEIRVKKMCLQDGFTKKILKQWGVKIKRDYKHKVSQVKILILPNNMRLAKSSLGCYRIVTITGRNLGHIYGPFELDGGLLIFAP